MCCLPGFPWGQGHVGLAPWPPWHLLWLLWGKAQPQGPHGIATLGDLCHYPGDLEAPLAQQWGCPSGTVGSLWGRAKMWGRARTTIGGGAKAQCGVEPVPLGWSQGHMNRR